jgi:hypothetical protein
MAIMETIAIVKEKLLTEQKEDGEDEEEAKVESRESRGVSQNDGVRCGSDKQRVGQDNSFAHSNHKGAIVYILVLL